MQIGGQNARLIRRFQDHRPGSVAKQYASAAVLEVQDAGENFCADYQRATGATGLNQGIGDGERIDKSAAHRLDIKSRPADSAKLALQNTCSGGKHHIRRRCGDDDEIDIAGRAPRRLQGRLAGVQCQIATKNTVVREVARADTAALDDPVVGCLNAVLR